MRTATSEARAGSGIEMEGFAEVAQKQSAKAILATLWCVQRREHMRVMKSFYRLRQDL